jgi:hypothetical protein
VREEFVYFDFVFPLRVFKGLLYCGYACFDRFEFDTER